MCIGQESLYGSHSVTWPAVLTPSVYVIVCVNVSPGLGSTDLSNPAVFWEVSWWAPHSGKYFRRFERTARFTSFIVELFDLCDSPLTCFSLSDVWSQSSAKYLHKELPVRIAHRIKGFRSLPFIIGCNPTILQVVRTAIRQGMLSWRAFPRCPPVHMSTYPEARHCTISGLKHR